VALQEVRGRGVKAMTLIVKGKPEPWSRPRPRRFGGFMSPHKLKPRYHLIVGAALRIRPGKPWAGPLRMDVDFVMPRPKSSAGGWHIATPDRSNLLKLVEDALQDARVFVDDSQFCDGIITKRYARTDEMPGAVITITRLEEGAAA
jgi:Holliday junction resolvase RusA-like endonuclease